MRQRRREEKLARWAVDHPVRKREITDRQAVGSMDRGRFIRSAAPSPSSCHSNEEELKEDIPARLGQVIAHLDQMIDWSRRQIFILEIHVNLSQWR